MKEVLKLIVKDLNCKMVNTTTQRPKYPYLTYNILNASTDNHFTGVMTTEEIGSKIHDIHTTQPNYILSINSYSNNQIEALDEIEKAWDYFKHIGYDDLVKAGGVVVRQTDIGDRTIKLVDSFEYRFGFDVKIRRVKEIKKDEYWIEEADTDLGGIK